MRNWNIRSEDPGVAYFVPNSILYYWNILLYVSLCCLIYIENLYSMDILTIYLATHH